MPAFEFQEQRLLAGRTRRLAWKIFDEETGQPVAIALTDVVRAKLALRPGDAPVLDLTSNPAGTLPGGSTVVIEDRGSVGNPDPTNDRPAAGYVYFAPADTLTIPTTPNGWLATDQRKRYVLDLFVVEVATGDLQPFGRGFVVVERSPGGPTTP